MIRKESDVHAIMQCFGYFDREGHSKGPPESSSRSFLTFDRTSAIGRLFILMCY